MLLRSSIYLQHPPVDLGVARVSTCGHVPRHPVNALPLRRRITQLGYPPVDGFRHAAQLVGVRLAFLAKAPVRKPLVESLGFPPTAHSMLTCRDAPRKERCSGSSTSADSFEISRTALAGPYMTKDISLRSRTPSPGAWFCPWT